MKKSTVEIPTWHEVTLIAMIIRVMTNKKFAWADQRQNCILFSISTVEVLKSASLSDKSVKSASLSDNSVL